MFDIAVSTNFAQLQLKLTALETSQFPFACARALTATAKSAGARVTAAMPEIFDRPTPFTERAIGIVPATKQTLAATVFVKRIQAAYLSIEETGGDRFPAGQAIVVPDAPGVTADLNEYGNMPRGYLQKLKGSHDIFVGTVRGIGGFWRRLPYAKGSPNRLVLIADFRPSGKYKPRFGFEPRIFAAAAELFPAVLETALAEAVATAR